LPFSTGAPRLLLWHTAYKQPPNTALAPSMASGSGGYHLQNKFPSRTITMTAGASGRWRDYASPPDMDARKCLHFPGGQDATHAHTDAGPVRGPDHGPDDNGGVRADHRAPTTPPPPYLPLLPTVPPTPPPPLPTPPHTVTLPHTYPTHTHTPTPYTHTHTALWQYEDLH